MTLTLMQLTLQNSPLGRSAAEIAIETNDFAGQTLVPFDIA
jgi:hypothetical protein